MKDTQFLQDLYDKYLDAAKKCEQNGQLEKAKQYYLLASSKCLEIAKETTSPLLKEAKIKKSKALLNYAEGLPVSERKQPVKKTQANKTAPEQNDEEQTFSSSPIPDLTFDDVAGLEDVKKEIRAKMITPFLYPDQYKLFKKQTGGGVLLYGPPGTGKTMIAKAIAGELKAPFYAIKSSDIVSKWVGDSEKNIASLFESARQNEKAVIFIDEMDSLFARRGEDKHNDKRVNEFLQQMDGFAGKQANLLILGATNRPWDIDEAAMRSGRFSTKIYIPLPDKDARKYLFKRKLQGVPYSSDIDFDELANLSNNMSGADIEECIERAKERPLDERIAGNDKAAVTMDDCIKAILAVKVEIDIASIAEFEKYAGRNKTPAVQQPVEKKPIETKKELPPNNPPVKEEKAPIVTIEADNTEFDYFVGKQYSFSFRVNGASGELYVEIDDKKLMCQESLGVYKVKEFTISHDGTFVAKINTMLDKTLGEIELHFSSGIVENDMGI